jgi:hypothetical protein
MGIDWESTDNIIKRHMDRLLVVGAAFSRD